jgi:3-dehydroquinate synthase
LLKTLPKRELLAGYAEVVKYGALGDAQFFEWLEANGAKALGGDEAIMVKAVAHSCRMKADIVARDERETGDRALLNLGHTFGHALEAATGFSDRLIHGEGVAIGMALAFRLSVKLGLCPGQDAERFIRHLQTIGLPSAIGDVPGARPSPGELVRHMAHDKKVTDGQLTFILLKGLGQAFVTREVPLEAVKSVLTDG